MASITIPYLLSASFGPTATSRLACRYSDGNGEAICLAIAAGQGTMKPAVHGPEWLPCYGIPVRGIRLLPLEATVSPRGIPLFEDAPGIASP